MRIEVGPGQAADNVCLWLTVGEAKELRDSIDQLIVAKDPQRHEHISAADYQTEITVVIEHA